MKIFLPLILVLLIALAGCSKSKKNIYGSGKIVTQERKASDFRQILFTGSAQLFISQGEQEKVEITGDDNIINLITTDVIEGTLRIDYKKSGLMQLINATEPVKIFIHVITLNEIRLAGSGTVTGTTPLSVDQIKLSISGSGIVNLKLIGHKLISISSGSGNFHLTGAIENQDIWISGSGIYDAEHLNTHVANINITGIGKVLVHAEDELDVRISGAGTVIYQGNPLLRQSISGVGKILQDPTHKSETAK